jgi:hypothetical protein
MRFTVFPLLAGLLVTGLLGCDAVERIDSVEYVDAGRLCLESDGSLAVDLQVCLSSSCDTLSASSCTGTLDGSTLTVESTGTVDSVVNGECTDDCGLAIIACDEVEPPSDPTALTVEYAGDTTTWAELPDCGF